MVQSLHSSPETIQHCLLISYTPMQNNFFLNLKDINDRKTLRNYSKLKEIEMMWPLNAMCVFQD